MKRFFQLLICCTAPFWLAPAQAEITIDPNFRAPRFVEPSPAIGISLLPDGRFFRFLYAETLVGLPAGPLTRYLPDGTLDKSFRFDADYYAVFAVLHLPDDKLLVSAARTTYGVITVEELLRLNPDGSVDSSFSPLMVADSDQVGSVRSLLRLPDGKILASGPFSSFGGEARPGIVRLLSDGSLDSSFAVVPLMLSSFGSSPGTLFFNDPVLQPDGKIIIYGNFLLIGSDSYPEGVARLNGDGTLDQTFHPSGFDRVRTVRTGALQADGKILLGGRFSVSSSFASNPTGATYSNLPFVRLNPDGSADQSYGYFDPAASLFTMRDSVLQEDGKVVATQTSLPSTIYRFGIDGSLDASFRQPVFQFSNRGNLIPQAINLRLLAGGRFLVGGAFTDVDAAASPDDSHHGVARFLNNGALDPNFATSTRTGYRIYPNKAERMGGGLTYVVFQKFAFSGDAAVPNNLSRLTADGTLDSSYDPFAGAGPGAALESDFLANTFARLSNGTFYVLGTKGPDGEFRYGRLFANGEQDLGFSPDPAVAPLFDRYSEAFDSRKPAAMSQMNAGVLIWLDSPQGTVNGAALRRLAPGGNLDLSFRLADSISSGLVWRDFSSITRVYADAQPLAVQPDGKILFVYLQSETSARLVRLNGDGSLDGSFSAVTVEPLELSINFPQIFDPQTQRTLQPRNGVIEGQSILDAEVQSDGRIVIVGPFKSINGVSLRGVARLNADGTLDDSFQTGQGPMWTSLSETETVRPTVEQVASNGEKLLLTGTFEAFDGSVAPGIVQLNQDGSIDSSSASSPRREANSFQRSVLARQSDGSILLSGPYEVPGEIPAPSLLRILPSLSLTSSVSRKTHGSAGAFDVDLMVPGGGIECRTGGAAGAHTLVFTLSNEVTSADAIVVSGTGGVDGTPAIAGPTVTVNLTGAADAQTVTVRLQNVTDSFAQTLPVIDINLKLLVGDTNGSGSVNSSDIGQTKAQSGALASAANFRTDVNVTGSITSSDISQVKARAGRSLPSSPNKARTSWRR